MGLRRGSKCGESHRDIIKSNAVCLVTTVTSMWMSPSCNAGGTRLPKVVLYYLGCSLFLLMLEVVLHSDENRL